MQNKQPHPSTDIVTKWNVQCKKRKKNSNNEGNPTKKHFVGTSGGFQCQKKKLDSVLMKCQYDLPLTERQYR